MASKLCPFCMRMTDSEICPHCGKNINYAGTPTHLPAGYVVDGKHPYVIGAALGQGGFGITYIALDMVTGERVAIKEYFPTFCCSRTSGTISAYPNQDDVFLKGRARFLDEARTLKSLSDLQSIVNVLDFFEFNNSAYLVMEYLDGQSLKEYAAKNGKFPAQPFLRQIRPMMEDIGRMHQRGVVHRDIAPDNIILLPDGQMKLIDFGAARSFVGDKSMTVVVKKGFAPVEQYFSTGTTACSDVYALAATIYYCITGIVPMDSAQRQNDGLPLDLPSAHGADIAPHQEQALLKALVIQQKNRTQSIQELLNELFTAVIPKSQTTTTQNHAGPVSENSGTAQNQTASQKPEKKKSPLRILIPALISILVLTCILFLNPATNSGMYIRGRICMAQEDYYAASVYFGELDDFLDSEDLLKESTYEHAKYLFSEGLFTDASPKFQWLGYYEDSHSYWEQSVYGEAESFFSEKRYDKALSRLELIPNYEKTYNLKNECLYQRGSLSLTSKHYREAYEDLSQIPESYKQTSTLLNKTKLDWGNQIISKSDVNSARTFRNLVTLTASESDSLYSSIISKDFYDSFSKTNSDDFKTRRLMMDTLVGNYPLKKSLCTLFDEFTEANDANYIRDHHALFAELWDVPVVENIIKEEWNICIWLLGKWKNSSGSLEFYEKNNDDSIWSTISLPWVEKPSGTAHWDIVDMEYIWTDNDYNKLASVYRFTLTGPNTMDVYCYKNGKTYSCVRSN